MSDSTDVPNEALDDMSSDELERKLDDTRVRVSEKMQILQDELEPKKLVNTGIEYVREKVDFDDTMNFITSNPLPVVLTATGLVWLAAAYQDRSSRIGSDYAETQPDGYTDPNYPESLSPESFSAFPAENRPAARREAVSPGREPGFAARRLPAPENERHSTSTSDGEGLPAVVVLAGLGVGLLAGLYLS